MIHVDKHWSDVKLSKNFWLGEFVVSDSFPSLSNQITPTFQQANNAYFLAKFLLQPVRDKFGYTTITSGIRDLKLNRAVGGADTSRHLTGASVDFECIRVKSMKTVYLWIQKKMKWPGQLFYYKGRHCHAGLPEYGLRKNQRIKV